MKVAQNRIQWKGRFAFNEFIRKGRIMSATYNEKDDAYEEPAQQMLQEFHNCEGTRYIVK